MTDEVSSANPVVKFHISGLNSNDIPYLLYGGKQYTFIKVGADEYISDTLSLSSDDNTFSISVGGVIRPYKILVNLGATTNDLFDF